MANYTINNKENSYLIVKGVNSAPYSRNDLSIFFSETNNQILKIYDKSVNKRLIYTINLSSDTVDVDGVSAFANASELYVVLEPIFFLINSSSGGSATASEGLEELGGNITIGGVFDTDRSINAQGNEFEIINASKIEQSTNGTFPSSISVVDQESKMATKSFAAGFNEIETYVGGFKATSKGVSGDAVIETVGNQLTIRTVDGTDNTLSSFSTEQINLNIERNGVSNNINISSSGISIGDGINSIGLTGEADYSDNIGPLGYTQKSYVDSRNLSNQIIVTQDNFEATIGDIIDSSKEYFLYGIINMGSTQITIPPSGLTLRGYSFDLSGLVSTEDNYTMFVSETPVIGSGGLLGFDYLVTTSGLGSKVYELFDSNGFNALELQRVNYIDCSSLGDLHNYRQGLESGTGRFGGSPSLTLHGTWLGGFRVATSIVRGMSNTTSEPLFKSGASFIMNSRFLTDINVDLGALQPFCDFNPSNFPNSSTLQISGAIFTREGTTTPNDINVFTNTNATDLEAQFTGNKGISNTHVGGNCAVTAETTTIITLTDTFLTLNGTWIGSDLQHFDSPSNGELRHLGNDPREYEIYSNLVIDGGPNDSITVRFRKWDDSEGIFIDLNDTSQTRVINNLQGTRDVAYFNILTKVTLDQNDYIYLQVKNDTDTTNVTAEL